MPIHQAARRTDMQNLHIGSGHSSKPTAVRLAQFFLTLFTTATAFAQSASSPYLTAYRYLDGGLLAGTISPAPSGQSNFLATRNTYDSNGRVEKIETGVRASWQADSISPASWSGFDIRKVVTYAYDAGGNKI